MKYEEYSSNGRARPSRPADIQSDVEEIRAEMSQTLAELEDRFSLGELVDEVVARIRSVGEGGGDFFKNLGTTVRDHPVPVVLIGAGVASLIWSGRQGKPTEGRDLSIREPSGTSSIDERAGHLKERAGELKGRASERTGELRERAGEFRERASEVKSRVGERAGELRERAGDMRSRAGERASRARERIGGAARGASERTRRVAKEQPLVLAGIGIALGAIAAAAVPMSRREHETMGAKRDEMFGSARDTMRENVQRAKEQLDRGYGEGGEYAGTQQERRSESLTEPGTSSLTQRGPENLTERRTEGAGQAGISGESFGERIRERVERTSERFGERGESGRDPHGERGE